MTVWSKLDINKVAVAGISTSVGATSGLMVGAATSGPFTLFSEKLAEQLGLVGIDWYAATSFVQGGSAAVVVGSASQTGQMLTENACYEILGENNKLIPLSNIASVAFNLETITEEFIFWGYFSVVGDAIVYKPWNKHSKVDKANVESSSPQEKVPTSQSSKTKVVAEDGKGNIKNNNPQKNIKGSTNSVDTPINSGVSQPRDVASPNSIYEQINPDGTVKSRAFYDENGRQFSRQDFDHRHFDKKTKQYYQPHEHNYYYNKNGQPIGKSDGPLPSGYTNMLTK